MTKASRAGSGKAHKETKKTADTTARAGWSREIPNFATPESRALVRSVQEDFFQNSEQLHSHGVNTPLKNAAEGHKLLRAREIAKTKGII
jgi:hypothetical protein